MTGVELYLRNGVVISMYAYWLAVVLYLQINPINYRQAYS